MGLGLGLCFGVAGTVSSAVALSLLEEVQGGDEEAGGPQMVLDWMRHLSVLFERFMAFVPVGGIWDTVRGVAWRSEQPFPGSVAGGRALAFWPCF